MHTLKKNQYVCVQIIYIQALHEKVGWLSASEKTFIIKKKKAFASCACIQTQTNHSQTKLPWQAKPMVPEPDLIIGTFSKLKRAMPHFPDQSCWNEKNCSFILKTRSKGREVWWAILFFTSTHTHSANFFCRCSKVQLKGAQSKITLWMQKAHSN